MSEIIEDNTGEYVVMRFCAILEIKDKESEIDATDPIIQDLHDVFDDLTYNTVNHSIELRQRMSYFKLFGFSNKQMVELLINKLKEYLKIADITIIEQRLPLAKVRYKLEES